MNLDSLDTRITKRIMDKAVDIGYNDRFWTTNNQISILLSAAIMVLRDKNNKANPVLLEDWINYWYNRLPLRNRRSVKTSF